MKKSKKNLGLKSLVLGLISSTIIGCASNQPVKQLVARRLSVPQVKGSVAELNKKMEFEDRIYDYNPSSKEIAENSQIVGNYSIGDVVGDKYITNKFGVYLSASGRTGWNILYADKNLNGKVDSGDVMMLFSTYRKQGFYHEGDNVYLMINPETGKLQGFHRAWITGDHNGNLERLMSKDIPELTHDSEIMTNLYGSISVEYLQKETDYVLHIVKECLDDKKTSRHDMPIGIKPVIEESFPIKKK